MVRAKCNRLQSLPNQMAMICTNLTSGYFRDMQLTKEIFLPAFQELQECLKMAAMVLSEMEWNTQILADSRYAYLFTVEDVNDQVARGVPFRTAYRQVGEEVQAGVWRYDACRNLKHTHEGSIGNLCLEEIHQKFQRHRTGFPIENIRSLEEKLMK